jgi:hypothetical protein
MTWECPEGCHPEYALVCGGDAPWGNHGWAAGRLGEEHIPTGSTCPNFDTASWDLGSPVLPNLYFGMTPGGEYTKDLATELPFLLTEHDWALLHRHADAGCGREPQCPECGGSLLRSGGGKVLS